MGAFGGGPRPPPPPRPSPVPHCAPVVATASAVPTGPEVGSPEGRKGGGSGRVSGGGQKHLRRRDREDLANTIFFFLVVMIGTAHISEDSVALVRRTIQQVKPDVVMIELDPKRVARAGVSTDDLLKVRLRVCAAARRPAASSVC